MRNNFLKNYKFMLKTISKASASRVWLDIFFTVINDLFSILYHVIFFSYFMEMVEKGKSIIQVSKVLIVFVLIDILFELLNTCYSQKYIPRNDVKLSLFLKNMIYKKIMAGDIECFDNPEKHLTRIRQFMGQLRLKTAFISIDLFFQTKRIHNILHFCIRINLCIHCNILSDGRSINIDILKDNSVLASIVLYIVVTNIFLIISDGSLIRIVQAQNIQSARQHSTNGK